MMKTTLYSAGNYTLMYISHKRFSKRIRLHVGKGIPEDFSHTLLHVRYELSKYEKEEKRISDSAVERIAREIISDEYKKSDVFEYLDEYWLFKANTINQKLGKPINKRTISQYKDSLRQFYQYSKYSKIRVWPEVIDKQFLDSFYWYLVNKKCVCNNTAVKRHKAVKSFIKWLTNYKDITIKPSYKLSVFNERYLPTEQDYALTTSEIEELIKLKRSIDKNEIEFETKSQSRLSNEIKLQQIHAKKEGIKLALDMFLIMSSTGMYLADMKSCHFMIGKTARGSSNLNYYRSKTNELAKAIPIFTKKYSILPELLMEYGIQNNSIFGLRLSDSNLRKHLKTIGELAGFTKPLQFKVARKTFASLYYFELNLEPSLISKMLGHTSRTETLKYLRIDDDMLADNIQESVKY